MKTSLMSSLFQANLVQITKKKEKEIAQLLCSVGPGKTCTFKFLLNIFSEVIYSMTVYYIYICRTAYMYKFIVIYIYIYTHMHNTQTQTQSLHGLTTMLCRFRRYFDFAIMPQSNILLRKKSIKWKEKEYTSLRKQNFSTSS